MKPVFECLDCGGTFFYKLIQLPPNPSNELDVRSIDVYCCNRCRTKYHYIDDLWERVR